MWCRSSTLGSRVLHLYFRAGEASLWNCCRRLSIVHFYHRLLKIIETCLISFFIYELIVLGLAHICYVFAEWLVFLKKRLLIFCPVSVELIFRFCGYLFGCLSPRYSSTSYRRTIQRKFFWFWYEISRKMLFWMVCHLLECLPLYCLNGLVKDWKIKHQTR